MAVQNADQELFERKVIKFVLPKYKKAFNEDFNKTKHVETLEQLGNLEYIGTRIGGYKETRPMQLGSLLNAFKKTSVCTAFNKFLAGDQSDDWMFIFSIPSTTALYIILPEESNDGYFSAGRFTARVQNKDCSGLTIMRLDDFLDSMWHEFDD